MPNQIDPQVKARRSARLAECEAELRKQYARSLIEQRLQILLEEVDLKTQTAAGTACRYLPATTVPAASRTALPLRAGSTIDATVCDYQGDRLMVRPAS
jgi:tRNA A37 methylthiotransferase MiaB